MKWKIKENVMFIFFFFTFEIVLNLNIRNVVKTVNRQKLKGIIITYPHVVYPKFKLPTCNLKFNILRT